MDPVRIGCVQYLNTIPLIEGLGAWRDAEIVTAVPSRLVGMLRAGEVDVALCSAIDAARGGGEGGPLVMLPVGMIGSDGPTLTVALFSAVPPERITTIHADTDSHTSVALVQIVMDRRHGVRPEMVGFDARGRDGAGERGEAGWPEAVLLIGDKVVTDAPPAGRYPHRVDLGEAWKALTGLPFVYAVWMCRAGEEGSVKVRTAAAALDRARRHNTTRLDRLVAGNAAARGWPAALAAEYVGERLRYAVGERERAAVARFFDEAKRLGLSPVGGEGARWGGTDAA